MRAKNFLLYGNTLSTGGAVSIIANPVIYDSQVRATDTVITLGMLSGTTAAVGSSNDPYGNENLYAYTAYAGNGNVSGINFDKSSSVPNTTDKIDIVVIATRG